MAELNTYIFDRSVEGQFATEADSKEAISGILSLVSLLADAQNVTVSVSYDRTALYQAMMTAEMMFGTVLDRNRDLRVSWNKTRLQLMHALTVNEAAYRDAETGMGVALLCIRGSQYAEPDVVLLDASGVNSRKVLTWVSLDTLSKYLSSKNWLRTYSEATKYVPRDEQTILVDTSLFQLTTHHNHQRKVYERIGADEYWCCDNLHTGRSAELEVFRKSDLTHIGTCGIFDIATFSKEGAVKGRVMDEN